jgi:hypothetical protein
MICLKDNSFGREGFFLHGAGGATVSLIVVGTLALVEGLLGGALAVVGLEAASDTVGGIGEGLLDLVLGGLAGVRSNLLLSLCWRKKRLVSRSWPETLEVHHVLVEKSLRPASDMMIDG